MDGIRFSVSLKEISSLEGTLANGSIIPNIEMLYGIRGSINQSFRRGKKIAKICRIAPRSRPMQVERTSKSPPLISVPKLLVKMLIAQSPNSLLILSTFDDYSWIINSWSLSTRSLSSLVLLYSALAVILPSGRITNNIFCPLSSTLSVGYCLFHSLFSQAMAAFWNCSARENT